MAINIDTVYQKVLAIANKEQRGYINPQQFNLFANQAQMDIFEDYFFKLNQLEFGQKNSTQYADLKTILLEKIQPFEKTGTMEYFMAIGEPQSGWSVCGHHCQCQLEASGSYDGNTLINRDTRGKT